jgi:bacterioferritin-associated ferredoxin
LIKVTDEDGNLLGRYPIMSFNNLRKYSRTTILRVQVPRNIATLVAGVQLDSGWSELQQASMIENHPTDQEAIVCRCEHISANVIRGLIRDGVTDINQIKAESKATMGACGGKTCLSLIKKIFKEEGVSQDKVTDPTQRPLFVEVPLEILAKNEQQWEQS